MSDPTTTTGAPSHPPNETGVQLRFAMVFCTWHGEPLRVKWPQGYAKATLALFQTVLDQKEFQQECDGDPTRINSALWERPLCCRVSDRQLLDVYRQIGIGERGFCVLCRKKAWGTLCRVASEVMFAQVHVCFRCIVQTAKTRPDQGGR